MTEVRRLEDLRGIVNISQRLSALGVGRSLPPFLHQHTAGSRLSEKSRDGPFLQFVPPASRLLFLSLAPFSTIVVRGEIYVCV